MMSLGSGLPTYEWVVAIRIAPEKGQRNVRGQGATLLVDTSAPGKYRFSNGGDKFIQNNVENVEY